MILSKELKISNLEEPKILIFENNSFSPIIRRYGELRDLYLKKAQLDENLALYYVYRGLYYEELKKSLEYNQIRIDLTLMEPFTIDSEYNKTHGHYHPEAAPGRSFPEIYIVLEGKVSFILQRGLFEKIEEVFIIDLEKGEQILIPPNYGHVMVNLSKERSVTLNIVSDRFIPLYEPYSKLKGAAIYLLENGFIKNSNYEYVKEIKRYKSKFKIDNIFKDIIENSVYIKALNRPYLIDNYFYFLEQI